MVASPVADNTDNFTHWLTLYHTPGIGAVTFHRLLERFGKPDRILQTSPAQLQACGLNLESIHSLQHPARECIDRDLAWLEQPGNRILTCQDHEYPPLLLQIPDPPPLLYVHGDCKTLSRLQLAMVGSRNPTESGRRTANEFARYLSLAGLTITSGLALGIDAASHEGALQAGRSTIAVMGTGLDRVYPSSHGKLAHRIAELSLNPGICAQDGFLTSHVIESLRLPERELVKEYLGASVGKLVHGGEK